MPGLTAFPVHTPVPPCYPLFAPTAAARLCGCSLDVHTGKRLHHHPHMPPHSPPRPSAPAQSCSRTGPALAGFAPARPHRCFPATCHWQLMVALSHSNVVRSSVTPHHSGSGPCGPHPRQEPASGPNTRSGSIQQLWGSGERRVGQGPRHTSEGAQLWARSAAVPGDLPCPMGKGCQLDPALEVPSSGHAIAPSRCTRAPMIRSTSPLGAAGGAG